MLASRKTTNAIPTELINRGTMYIAGILATDFVSHLTAIIERISNIELFTTETNRYSLSQGGIPSGRSGNTMTLGDMSFDEINRITSTSIENIRPLRVFVWVILVQFWVSFDSKRCMKRCLVR